MWVGSKIEDVVAWVNEIGKINGGENIKISKEPSFNLNRRSWKNRKREIKKIWGG
jgi:hypothetical protein